MLLQTHFYRPLVAAERLAHRGDGFAVCKHLAQLAVLGFSPRAVGVWIGFAHFGDFFRPAAGFLFVRGFGGVGGAFFGRGRGRVALSMKGVKQP